MRESSKNDRLEQDHEGRAGGKVILLGEHAVVAGAPALVAGLPEGVIARDLGPAPVLTVCVPEWDLEISASHEGDIPARGVAALDDALASHGVPRELRSRRIIVDALIPARAGLGSSAALAVGVCRLVGSLAGRPDLQLGEEVASVAGASEIVFHGRPSGVDVAAAASAGVSIFSIETGARRLRHLSSLHLVVADSGRRPATEVMVRGVRERIERDESARADLSRLGDLAESGAAALSFGDLLVLGEAMNEAHGLLARLGVSTATLDELASECRELGALGAKLTGAGGGGCLVALCQEESEGTILDHLRRRCPWARSFTIHPSHTNSDQEAEPQDHVRS